MDFCESILNIILKSIQEKCLSEYSVAKSCSLNASFFSDWKSGRRKCPSFEKVYAILKFLKISIDSLNIENCTYEYVDEHKDKNIVDVQSTVTLNDDEMRVLTKYRSLDIDGKDSIKGMLIAEERRTGSMRGTTENLFAG